MKFIQSLVEPAVLFEMPQSVFPTDFHLMDDIKNAAFTHKFFETKRPIAIKQIGDYTLYESTRAYALIENDTQRAAYAMQFTVGSNSYLRTTCAQQVMVWRDSQVFQTRGLTEFVFFECLLPKYRSIITDSQQTEDGQRFWDNRILDALRMDLWVYYVSLIPPREITQIKSDVEYRTLGRNKEIWGIDNKHQARRIVISAQQLGEL
jgi:hypothetical protein